MATADTDAEASSTDVAAAGGRDDDDSGKPAAAFPELQFSSLQDGGGDDDGGGGGPGSDDPAAADQHDDEDGEASASSSLCHEPPPPPPLDGSPPAAAAIAPAASGSASASAPPKASEEPERPFRRTFQIPRKSREKKALFQPLTPGSREFEDVLSILHSSFLEPTSVASFTYRRACLIHNELLEKEFTEKRRELKSDGRLDKELSESYAFLLVDRYQVQSICEKGLQVGHSKVTILGSPSMGIYLSRYADILQANPLEAGAVGDVVIFKIMKGKIKSIYDPMSVKSLEPVLNKSALDPTPKHECHVSKNASRITSLLAYRAYELTQYYFYEYGFDELRRRPRHVCPYAVVSFIYKDDMQSPKFMSSLRSNSFNADRNIDKCTYYTLWKGQLLNRGKLLCPISLRSTTRAFLPIKLPEKLDVETVMTIDHLKQKIPPALFYKDTYLGPSEVLKNGMYCSLYEVVEQTRIGSNMESLLQKLEREKLVLVKPLQDRGYLFLLSPYQMMSPYEHQTVKSRMLHALFLFQEPRCIITSHKGSATAAAPQERQDGMPDMIKIAQFLQFSLIQCRKEFKSINTVNFHSAMEKYVSEFFKRGFGSGKREFFMFSYDSRLDDKKFLYSAPRNKSHIDDCLHTYIFRPDVYQLLVSQLEDLFEENRRRLQFSPLPDYEGQEDEASGAKMKCGRRNSVRGDVIQPETQKSCHSLDYDEDRVKELIDLIQCKKKHVSEDPDTEDMRSKTPSKRKLEDVPDNARKFAKTSSVSEIYHLYEESPQPVTLLGREPDLRLQQQDACSPAIADRHKVYHWLSKTLANARHSDAALTDTVNKALGLSTDSACEELRPEHPCEHEQALGASARSPLLEADVASLKYPSALTARQLGTDHKLHLKEDPNVINVNHFEECSLCPAVPIEHGFHRHQPKSNDDEETEIHWKLIPITGCSRPGGNTKSPEDQHGKRGDRHTPGVPSLEESLACLPPQDTFPSDPRGISRERSCDYQPSSSPFADPGRGTSEEGMLPGQGMAVEEQCVPAAELSPVGETTESTVLGEFHLFSRKIEEILKQKNVSYVSRISTPVFSTQEKMKRLSEFIYCKTSKAGIQEFVDGFHEKLNTIIIKASATGENLPQASPNDPEVKTAVNPPERQGTSMSSGAFTCKDAFEPLCTHEELSSISAEAEMNQAHHGPKLMVTSDYALPADTPREPQEKETSPPGGVNISAPPALSNFISQLEPEVFNSLVKIMKDVQKNTVKFYIHEEEKSVLSKEIKEYLTKLGNTECHPERFLERRSQLDKLLVIIQNEDIAGFIHKVPGLVTLKKLPCVSFAGVDSLDDVKNHTYNELFVSGGFIVSDESVLNLDVVTIESLKMFLTFLEELSTPEGKWQWKIHCKFQKKLKELGRLNRNALSLLSLLNAYQKKHLVEILSYHKCDSQTRNAPELDCLIRLQAQNIQQRHIVFLTEKNIKMLSSYTDNGVIVASAGDFMQNFQSLVGYHSSSTEESLPQLGAHESLESQSDAVLTFTPLELGVGISQH